MDIAQHSAASFALPLLRLPFLARSWHSSTTLGPKSTTGDIKSVCLCLSFTKIHACPDNLLCTSFNIFSLEIAGICC
uniref:Putative secreted protein n=1 Tax=Amblyomma parvum TaxID=251391 RepID=A0A023G2F2_AMBPA